MVSCFINFPNSLRELDKKEHIAFDGKVLRGSKQGKDINALQLMTVMVVENGLIIYQKETDKKTNEIPVMQSMLKSMKLDLLLHPDNYEITATKKLKKEH